ncbi:MAG: MCP four helix bundle domain-containing protein, partial [Chromatiales bacterium]|nr:MCP four helix bundle domain-containing protein [Chromatiales bacterium]
MYLMERLQLKLSFSLATAFILVLAMLAGMIGYGLHHLATINRHLQYNTHGHNVVLDHVNTMRITARERTLILSRMIYLDDPFVLDELHMRFNALAGRFVRSREQLLKQHLDPVATALLAQQGRLTLSATTVQDQVLKLALNGEHDAARKLLSNQGIPAQDAVFNILNELYQVQEHEMLRATEEAGSAYHHARLLMVLIGSIAVVLGCLIALFVITQNRRYRAQLIREKTLAHTALHSIADAVITTDTKGNIEQINPQASEMLGLENQCV